MKLYYKILNLFITHGLKIFFILAGLALYIPTTQYAEILSPVTVVFWKTAMLMLGAWIGNMLYIHYFCDDQPIEECKTPDVHRLYFILGISLVFAIR